MSPADVMGFEDMEPAFGRTERELPRCDASFRGVVCNWGPGHPGPHQGRSAEGVHAEWTRADRIVVYDGGQLRPIIDTARDGPTLPAFGSRTEMRRLFDEEVARLASAPAQQGEGRIVRCGFVLAGMHPCVFMAGHEGQCAVDLTMAGERPRLVPIRETAVRVAVRPSASVDEITLTLPPPRPSWWRRALQVEPLVDRAFRWWRRWRDPHFIAVDKINRALVRGGLGVGTSGLPVDEEGTT